MPLPFQLFLFGTDPELVRRAVAAGVDGIVVDWERQGKRERQARADTQINRDTPQDLERVRASTRARVLCRINPFGAATPEEVERAILGGADEILLPMVRTVEEVQAALELLSGRAGLGILLETVDALDAAEALGRLPLTRAYVGLNDLAIERRSANIFVPLIDGALERLRRAVRLPFGFGGLTVPELGQPIPCRLLMGEMARLDCHFSFLRRSFHRDTAGRVLAVEVARIREALERAWSRSPEEVRRDRLELEGAVRAWRAYPHPTGTA